MARTLDEYIALIPSWNASRPKFQATVKAVIQPLVDMQNAADILRLCFDVDTAIGAQLDAVGVRVGVSRVITIPLPDPYFSLDVTNLGFDVGVWYSPWEPLTGTSSLDDYHYRILIKAKIATNRWDGTGAQAATIFQSILSDTNTSIYVRDNEDMSIDIFLSGDYPTPTTWAILTSGKLGLKPGAVRINSYNVVSVPGTPYFGFDVENEFISGFDVGSWPTQTLPT